MFEDLHLICTQFKSLFPLSSTQPLMEARLLSLLQSPLNTNQLKQIQSLITTSQPKLTPLFINSLLKLNLNLNSPNIDYAYQLFDKIPQPDPFLANSIISTLSKLSLHQKVLETLSLTHRKNTIIVHYSIPPVLKACTWLCASIEGKQVHSLVIRYGFYLNVFVQSGLIDLYSKSDDLGSAKTVFDEVIIKEPVPCNCLISGYSRAGHVSSARELFEEMPYRTQASWNTMITCYAHHGNLVEALRMYERMVREEKLQPNKLTLVTVLSVCAKMADLKMGMKVKELIDGQEFETNLVVRTALMEMYVKCGAVDEARKVFDQMGHRDVVAWSAMIAGYAQNRRSNEALELFERMKSEKYEPNEVTLVSVLSACGQLGSVEAGERIGSYVESRGLSLGVHIGSALVGMYAKCGNIRRARKVFDEMHNKDIVSWNSMIGGLAINGLANDAVDLYRKMLEQKFKPNDITFVGLLTACTHAGMIDSGLKFFNSMKEIHGIVPKVEHCSCVVDLFCKSGRLEDAYKFACEMEVEPNVVIWSILLSACKAQSNVDLAEKLVERLLAMDPDNSGYYVLLSSLYAHLGKWEEARKVRILMESKNVSKLPAYSWIELGDETHKFLIEDKSHARADEIYSMVDALRLHLKWASDAVNFDLELT